MIRIYTAGTVYPKRRHIFPLLKPFEKAAGFSDSERIKKYHISEHDITFVNDVSLAEFVVLPMSWNFYDKEHRLHEAEAIVNEAKQNKKQVLSFMVGDFGIRIKPYENLIVFRQSGDTTKLPKNHIGLPVFIEDPLHKHFSGEEITERPYTDTPVIGFCGQANASIINAAKEKGKTLLRNFQSSIGLTNSLPQQVLSTSYIRASVLKHISQNRNVISNFIYRNKYRAGAHSVEQQQKTTRAFYENMSDSDYMVCVRGAGNFSVRFYEALAMGKIPVYIDTNGLLPLRDAVDWKKHVVWVSFEQRNKAAAIVADFHKKLTPNSFKDLQAENRSLWLKKLTLGGFFKSYFETRPNI